MTTITAISNGDIAGSIPWYFNTSHIFRMSETIIEVWAIESRIID